MSNIADKIRTAQNKDGMLRRALERIIQLYTDKSHFVYELLQNAEDAGATCVRFDQYADRLEVLHNGRPFSEGNLQGLCDIGKSDKVGKYNQIGEFGVGFKSVFGICDTVRLYSEPSHYNGEIDYSCESFAVEIRDFVRPVDIEKEVLEPAYTTRFVFPYAVGRTFSGFSTIEQLRATIARKLQNLGVTTLLFMKSLESIEYHIYLQEVTVEGEYLLDKTIINDHCLLVSALGTAAENSKDTEITSYLRFTAPISPSSLRTVDIAFPVFVDDQGNYECRKAANPYVSVYFPTETESKLDFIVQGPFRTTPNRSSIPADEAENVALARATADLLKRTILELKSAGKFNMSFVKVLPLNKRVFDNFDLFKPLYDVVRELFSSCVIIPSKCGSYISAKNARLARPEKLTSLFSDEELTRLISDGSQYKWLPTFLTETNREYDFVYRYLSTELHIPVIRPEDLRSYFSSNPRFLPSCSKEWLIELYTLLENIGAAFSTNKNENNMLTAEIVLTSNGHFAAPYRRIDKTYIPNVFLPTSSINSSEINFVDNELYERCRTFFDNTLRLTKVNEYEYITKAIQKRYSSGTEISDDQHIDDIKHLLKYLKNDDYSREIRHLIADVFTLRCTDQRMRNPASFRVFVPTTENGINIQGYYQNIVSTVSFVDVEFYSAYDIPLNSLIEFGVRASLLVGEKSTNGVYETGYRGRQPEWYTTGDFRWYLSIDAIDKALQYISRHPCAKDSIVKSQTIFKILQQNESKLSGTVYISGATPNLINETCELLKYLRGDRRLDWDGRWLFTESNEVVSPRSISKHDLCQSYYGRINPNSSIYELLGFKKSESDEIDELKKIVTQRQLDALFEEELKTRFGISSQDLEKKFPVESRNLPDIDEEFEFPVVKVKNWDSLKKHVAEMLVYANPVKYEYKVRSVRVSNRPKEIKAYLHNMYRYVGSFKYACQMCHDVCSTIESAELFLHPETELDPLHLSLCNNCANRYASLRNNSSMMEEFKHRIMEVRNHEVENGEQVIIPLADTEIWFAQTHFAEIQELLKLEEEIKLTDSKSSSQTGDDLTTEDSVEKSGLSVYSEYIGKTITRKDGFKGTVTKVDPEYLFVETVNQKGEKGETKIQLKFFLSHKSVYEIK